MVTPVSSFQNEEVLFFQDGKYIFITVDGIHTHCVLHSVLILNATQSLRPKTMKIFFLLKNT